MLATRPRNGIVLTFLIQIMPHFYAKNQLLKYHIFIAIFFLFLIFLFYLHSYFALVLRKISVSLTDISLNI